MPTSSRAAAAFALTTTLHRRPSHTQTQRLRTIKESILGTRYQLSAVFIGNARARTLNRTYRGKDQPTNVLSFSLSPHEGELCIALPRAHREAHHFGRTPEEHVVALFIHGCLHLEGYRHGATMEREEQRLIQKFLGQ